MKPPPRRHIRLGIAESLPARHNAARHQHVDAYATLVLKGAYEQLSYAGRLRPECGDVLIQPTFDCHADRMLSAGLELIRLPWRHEGGFGGVYRGCHIDLIRQVAARDLTEAVALLEEELGHRKPQPVTLDHWADALAAALANDPQLEIAMWAQHAGFSREHVCRKFTTVYGVSPVQFRSEHRARAAWVRLTQRNAPLAMIAAELGFADQAHMTRAVSALTGATPTQWRRSHLFKTLCRPTLKLPA